MLQDIGNKMYKCEFVKQYPSITDVVLYLENKNILMKKNEDGHSFLTFADTKIAKFFSKDGVMEADVWRGQVRKLYPDIRIIRGIGIDEENYYIVGSREIVEDNKNIEMVSNEILRHFKPKHKSFAVATTQQIFRWQSNNQFCGRCGSKMKPSETERAMVCDNCHNIQFPKICPAVTVAIVNMDKLLLVRNRNSAFKRFALVAGYVEIGETFEDTVHREVMEEVGLKVKNVHYYKNQPWALTDAQMIGYFVELDATDEVKLQEEELLEARWFRADEIPPNITDRSLTYEMIGKFRREHIEETQNTDDWKAFVDYFDIE